MNRAENLHPVESMSDEHAVASVVDTVFGILEVDPAEVFRNRPGYRPPATRLAIRLSCVLLREQGFSNRRIADSLSYQPDSVSELCRNGLWRIENDPRAREVADEARRKLGEST